MAFTGQTQRWLWDNNLESKIFLLKTQDGTHKNSLRTDLGTQNGALETNLISTSVCCFGCQH